MTQRQRRYWKAWYKFSNYLSLSKAIKLEIPERIRQLESKYIEGLISELDIKTHEMYLLLKSSNAIRSANKISSTHLMTEDEICKLLDRDVTEKDEIADEREESDDND